jgi:hypothetical protein
MSNRATSFATTIKIKSKKAIRLFGSLMFDLPTSAVACSRCLYMLQREMWSAHPYSEVRRPILVYLGARARISGLLVPLYVNALEIFTPMLTRYKLISLFFGNYHIFNPRVDVEDPNYNKLVLERNHIFFGPFPLSYTDFVPREKRDGLAEIMNRVGANRKPF